MITNNKLCTVLLSFHDFDNSKYPSYVKYSKKSLPSFLFLVIFQFFYKYSLSLLYKHNLEL